MDKSMPIFFCPFRGPGTTFRSKNYIEYTLGVGINFYKFLGLEEPPMPSIALPRPSDQDISITTITKIDNLHDYIGDSTYGPPPIKEVRDPSLATKPLITLTDQHGWVYEHDSHGNIEKSSKRIRTSEDTEEVNTEPDNLEQDKLHKPETSKQDTPYQHKHLELTKNPTSYIGRKFWKTFDGFSPSEGTIVEYHPREGLWSISYEDGDEEDFDIDDMIEYFSPQGDHLIGPEPQTPNDIKIEGRVYASKEGENFLNICDSIGLPLHQRKLYYKWLGDAYGQFGETWDPKHPKRIGIYFNYPWNRGRKTIFRDGTQFPIPQDELWNKMIKENKEHGENMNPTHITALATKNITRRIVMSEWLRDRFRNEGQPCKTTTKDITDLATGKVMAPKNLKQALDRPDSELWKTAIRKELDALDELGVLSHHHKLSEIRDQGITTSAVPMQLLYDVKYHPDGTLDKYKVREVVQGHKGYMRRGEHFFNTFSASPSCRTTRLLQAITIGTGLHRHAWDICTAYLWADVKPRERIPIRYPRDLRKYDDDTGEELYAILKKNCYGMPQADRRYTQLRNKFINDEFNKGGWKCTKSRQDPCLFIFTSPKGHRSYVIIHTDDCDGHAEVMEDLKYIAKCFHTRFKIKICDPKFMLGVQRDITIKDGITYMNLTQPDFIETTFNTFKDFCPTRDIHTPFPPGMVLHGLLEEHNEEASKELIHRGYQSIAGSILWAARNCYPEVSIAANMICRLMSKPTELAWKCAVHTLKYLHGQSHRGVQFRSDGNKEPICYYDASNKADPSDGKSQYGYVIYMFNGPIVWGSKKHKHVGLSSTHDEYMALSQASRDIEWIRQILVEIGYPIDTSKPTPTLGDNDNATLYAREDLITPGNKFIIQEYHYAKECVERGITCPRRVDTKDNVSDILTKSVARPILTRLRPLLTGHGGLLPRVPDPPED